MSALLFRSWLGTPAEAWMGGLASVCLVTAALIDAQPYREIAFGAFVLFLLLSIVAFIRRPRDRTP